MKRQRDTQKQKAEVEQVLAAFADYIQATPYFEILWVNKLNCYVYLSLDLNAKGQMVLGPMAPEAIQSGEGLCEKLLEEIAQDVGTEAEKGDDTGEADEEERAEIARRAGPAMRRLPQYRQLAEQFYGDPLGEA